MSDIAGAKSPKSGLFATRDGEVAFAYINDAPGPSIESQVLDQVAAKAIKLAEDWMRSTGSWSIPRILIRWPDKLSPARVVLMVDPLCDLPCGRKPHLTCGLRLDGP